MDIFLTIAGLIIGISAFLYFVSAMDAGKRTYRGAKAKSSSNKQARTAAITAGKSASTGNAGGQSPAVPEPIRVLPEEMKDMMKQRTCPMCMHRLQRDEPLYATHIMVGKEKKVLIYGCPYCYKGERR